MERQIPDPLTVDDLLRDPNLIYAVRARGRRICRDEFSQSLRARFRNLHTRWTSARAMLSFYRLRTS